MAVRLSVDCAGWAAAASGSSVARARRRAPPPRRLGIAFTRMPRGGAAARCAIARAAKSSAPATASLRTSTASLVIWLMRSATRPLTSATIDSTSAMACSM